jgi:hypothetical protein
MPRCTEEETAKQVGCSTTGRRIAIINPPHASTGLARVFCVVVIVVVGCMCNCGHISSLFSMFVVGWNLSLDQRWMSWEEIWTLYYRCEGIMGVIRRIPEADQGQRLVNDEYTSKIPTTHH